MLQDSLQEIHKRCVFIALNDIVICVCREVTSLQQQIASISSELATSQQAYTTYRQRAKESLQKTAMDMNAAEKQAAELSALNKVIQVEH